MRVDFDTHPDRYHHWDLAVDGEVAQRFWELYLEAFAPLRTRAAARHVLLREEFDAEMEQQLVQGAEPSAEFVEKLEGLNDVCGVPEP